MIAVYIIVGIILYISIAVGSFGFFKFIRDKKNRWGRGNIEWLDNVAITSDDDSLSIACTFWFIGIPIILSRNMGIVMAFLFIIAMDRDKKDRA